MNTGASFVSRGTTLLAFASRFVRIRAHILACDNGGIRRGLLKRFSLLLRSVFPLHFSRCCTTPSLSEEKGKAYFSPSLHFSY